VKKAQCAIQAVNSSQHNHAQLSSSGSDSEPSPAFVSPDYYNMMQQYNAENSMSSSYNGSTNGHLAEDAPASSDIAMSSAQPGDQFQNFSFSQAPTDLFDSPQDLNRRTLTQEQFNTMQQSGLPGSGIAAFNLGMDAEAYSKVFPEYSQQDAKSQAVYDFADIPEVPMSAQQLSAPHIIADRNAFDFASTGAIQNHSVASSASSDWGGSRSSSVSTYNHDAHVAQPVAAPQSSQPPQHPTSTSSQWRPGQSVPVDFNQLSQEFRQIEQSRQPHQQYSHEQPLAWPLDEAYHERQNSQTAGITHSMSNVGLKTPQPLQHATFKSPTPAASLATRRQRSKPAPLGLAAMRSQSYSSTSQPGSPGPLPHHQQHQTHANLGASQPLRRIKSSNMINGVAQGRIQKTTPGSAQRSPMNRTFADAMGSPKGIRSISSQVGLSLAPPTPMSPREQARTEAARQLQQWRSTPGQGSRQASISEHDIEQYVPHAPTMSGPANVSSPPHTPLYPPQPQFAQHRVGKNIITENTPPQSAPATQLSFNSASLHPPPPQPTQQVQHQSVATSQAQLSQQAMQNMFATQPPHMMAPEPQFPMVDMSVPQQPQFTLNASEPMSMPHMSFPLGGVPMVDANGNIQMAMPQPQYQLVSHAPSVPSVSAPPINQEQQMHYPFPMTHATSSGIQISAHAPRVPAQPELFVHEYQPPADVKRAATPRKVATDSGPKNYTFANQTPEHFEKGKKATASASNHSPSSGSS
jgi:hypothetical protein